MANRRPYARISALLLAPLVLPPGGHALGDDQQLSRICRVVLHEERIEREDAELDLDVARSNVAAYGQIYELIAGLWAADAIDRMSYLHAKYDYDAAKLALEQSDLLVARQKAREEQYRLICGTAAAGESAADRSRAIERANMTYRNADCDQQAKAIDVARAKLEYDRQLLASVRELREGQVATRQDVILAEFAVEEWEKRLADAVRRTEVCRRELGRPDAGGSPPGD